MNVFLWVVGLRVVTALLIASILAPDIMQLRRRRRRHEEGKTGA